MEGPLLAAASASARTPARRALEPGLRRHAADCDADAEHSLLAFVRESKPDKATKFAPLRVEVGAHILRKAEATLSLR